MEGQAGMREINFTVTMDEANMILEGIGLLPFAKVYQLVSKLQEQARRQLDGDAASTGARPPAPPLGT
jgi:hypothetical protein